MKIHRFIVFVLAVLLIVSANMLNAQTADLTIQIKGLKVLEGRIQLGLYNNSDDFPKEKRELILLNIDVETTILTHTINDLPIGEYAIAFYHDVNSDGKCNKNWIGIPTESYGFSNNVRPKFSAPSFKKATFTHLHDSLIVMNLIH